MKRFETKYPNEELDLAGALKKAWTAGWLDEFSDDHFLIKAIEERLSEYPQLYCLPAAMTTMYPITKDNFQQTFCMNFSAKITGLINLFGEEVIKDFFEAQLSAGKQKYDEDQFFRALSEVSILSYFVRNAHSGVYEQKTNGDKNPEARMLLNNGVTVDIEVKTPEFSDFENIVDIVIPTVLLEDEGRKMFLAYCKEHGLNGHMPRVLKLKEFLNSAADKFEDVDHVNHMNLLYVNWSFSEFQEDGFEEAFSLLANDINGILTHKEFGLKLGVKEEFYDKTTAVIVYTESLQGMIFGDFRYVWNRGLTGQPHFGIIALHDDGDIFGVTGMNPYAEQLTPIITGIFKDPSHTEKLMTIIGEHLLK